MVKPMPRAVADITVSDCARLLVAERQARAEAEHSNRLKDDALAVVSHDLRAPLQAILGWLELIRTNQHDSRLLSRGLDVMARSVRFQARLVADLVECARVSSDTFQLDIHPVQLRSVVQSAVEMVEPTATLKQITLSWETADCIPEIHADPVRLQQVFWNVLSNAIKFTPDNGHIQIGIHRLDSRAEVVIEDDGIGIHAAFLPRVFDRFQHDDSHGGPDGLGLGLWIVRRVVHLHGGAVRADSAGDGFGARFTIALPLDERGVVSHTSMPEAATAPGDGS